MEEVDMQKESIVENKETSEVKAEKETKEIPKGYYLAEVPTGFANVIALDKEQVSAEALIIKMANALRDAGIMK